jgi:hypothetical protein
MYSLQVSVQCEQTRQDAILVEIPSTSRSFHQAFEGMEATAHKSGTELQMTGLSVVMYGDPVHI